MEDPNSEAFKLHLPRIYDYLWVAEDGMKMQVQKVPAPLNLICLYLSHLLVYIGCDIRI